MIDLNIVSRWAERRHALKKIGFQNSDTLGRKDWDTDRDMDDPVNVVEAIKNPFLLDQIKINESKASRRLFGKTQVFSNPINPNVRNRASHTDSVVSIASKLGDYLGFNVDLLTAGALAHDIGHVIYGHLGEEWFGEQLREIYKDDKLKFKHSINSIIVSQRIERKGLGLNLSYETLQLVYKHSGGDNPIQAKKGEMQEISVLVFADKVGYVAHDISDAFRYNIVKQKDLPDCMIELAGIKSSKNANSGNLQHGIVVNSSKAAIEESWAKGYFSFHESKVAQLFKQTRSWMFENVYKGANRKLQKKMLGIIYEYIKEEPMYKGIDPLFIMLFLVDWDKQRIYECIDHNMETFNQFGFNEIVREFPKEKIMGFFDFDTIDLDPKHFSKISL